MTNSVGVVVNSQAFSGSITIKNSSFKQFLNASVAGNFKGTQSRNFTIVDCDLSSNFQGIFLESQVSMFFNVFHSRLTNNQYGINAGKIDQQALLSVDNTTFTNNNIVAIVVNNGSIILSNTQWYKFIILV